MTLFKGRYRSETTRLQSHNYAGPGYYFVTICTKNRLPWFGEIVNGKMQLSDSGRILSYEWQQTTRRRPNVIIDEWIIMPDHFHAIVQILSADKNQRSVETGRRLDILQQDKFVDEFCNSRPVSTEEESEIFAIKSKTANATRKWKRGCLGAVINQFKMTCTKQIRGMGNYDFAWQPLYHDVIIRDAFALHRIRRYIQNNPANWRG